MFMSIRNLTLGATLLALGCVSVVPGTAELRTVRSVDLARYTGKWYEIATIPSWFQKDCVGVTAAYSLRADGDIRVENACRDKVLAGPERSVVGRAWVTDPTTNAKLEVSFFWPFSGAYWIIELDPDYRYAVVGHPSRDYLWVLSRTPHMSDALYSELLENARQQGYDVTRVRRTPQPSS
jgi:apolipoprotein D and lipocalin family protein